MSEQIRDPNQIWETLTDSQKEFCQNLSASVWSVGVDKDFLDYLVDDLGLKDDDVQELIQRGIIDARPVWQFHQELVDKNKEEAEKIRAKNVRERTFKEGRFLDDYRNNEKVATERSQELRYHLRDETFHNFAHSQLEDE